MLQLLYKTILFYLNLIILPIELILYKVSIYNIKNVISWDTIVIDASYGYGIKYYQLLTSP